jgi:hypothetical protein
MREIIAKQNHDFFFLKVKSHQRIAKSNLNHGFFNKVKSRNAGNNCLIFYKVKSRLGLEREFLESQIA